MYGKQILGIMCNGTSFLTEGIAAETVVVAVSVDAESSRTSGGGRCAFIDI